MAVPDFGRVKSFDRASVGGERLKIESSMDIF
jgi:hypothetical protein